MANVVRTNDGYPDHVRTYYVQAWEYGEGDGEPARKVETEEKEEALEAIASCLDDDLRVETGHFNAPIWGTD